MFQLDFSGDSIEKALAKEGEIISTVSGISMRPMLTQHRDMIVVEAIKRPLVKGDVPLYRLESGKLVLHRILKVRDNDYIIRGDNTYFLEYVPKEYVLGVLKGFYRVGKYYDCNKSRAYHAYIVYNRITYIPRKFWVKTLRPILSRVKRKIIKH